MSGLLEILGRAITVDTSDLIWHWLNEKRQSQAESVQQCHRNHIIDLMGDGKLEEAREQEKTSKELTKAIENLDKLKSDLLSDLPVEGLEVRDGDIFVDGIPFDRVNESARISLALEIARIRSGELGLVLCDGLECLDSKTFEAFRKKALKTGLQFIVTRVSDEERLTIRDGGKEAA